MALQLSGGPAWLCARHTVDLVCCSTWDDPFETVFIANIGCRFVCLLCALLHRAGQWHKSLSRVLPLHRDHRILLRQWREHLERLRLRRLRKPRPCHRELG